MRTRIKVTDLSPAQWDRLQLRAQAEYEFTPGLARVCVVFELATQTERHVEMPVHDFALLLTELHIFSATAEAALVETTGEQEIYSGGTYAYDESGLAHYPLNGGTGLPL